MDSEQEDIELVDLLVRHGADVNGGPAGVKTPLHYAAEQRHCVEKRGCTCYAEESKLPACAWRSNRRMIRALLSHGADPNRRDEFGTTPISFALMEDRVDDLVVLLNGGARPTGLDGNQETIWNIIRELDPRVVRLLLAHGADPNERNGYGETALHALAEHWDPERERPRSQQRRFMAIARMLLARGADARAVSNRGSTPLHLSRGIGPRPPHPRVHRRGRARRRRRQGRANAPASRGLVRSCRHGRRAARCGATVTRKDAAGLTPLHYLARARHAEPLSPQWCRVVRLLVGHGGRFDAQDDAGRTPLFHAAADLALARQLIANGGAASNAGPRGASPMHVAAYRDNDYLVRVLIAAGLDVDARDSDGRTPLHWAAFMGQNRALAALAAAPGIQLEAVDKTGHTPLGWAIDACQTKAAELLQAQGARRPPPAPARKNVACGESKEPPLHAAARTMNMGAARAAMAGGADVNARDGLGRTALHVAYTYAVGIPFDLYQLLVDKGAAVAARDARGRTPLHAV